MKMVIVFDTEDREGMENTIKMVEHLSVQYMGQNHQRANKRAFGKIEFIKLLRKFGRIAVENYQNDEDFDLEAIKSLKFTKQYADKVWRDKNE